MTDISSVKGLGFCVSVAHANYMAKYFNDKGIPSIALSSKSADDIRNDAKTDLLSGKINCIFTAARTRVTFKSRERLPYGS